MADQLYASYAYGRDLRRLVAIVGEEALTDLDRKYLKFADLFERQFITQGNEDRPIEKTLSIAWDLFSYPTGGRAEADKKGAHPKIPPGGTRSGRNQREE